MDFDSQTCGYAQRLQLQAITCTNSNEIQLTFTYTSNCVNQELAEKM